VPTVHVVEQTPVAPELVLAAARDFSERRAELWPDVHVEHFQVHELGETFADVTEGNPWPIGYVWERLRYDGSEPESVKGVVSASNILKPRSTWEIRATRADGGSRVEVIGVRHLRGFKGRLLAPVFPLGLDKRTVADHLRATRAQVKTSVCAQATATNRFRSRRRARHLQPPHTPPEVDAPDSPTPYLNGSFSCR
jgi:hypothetical protein